MVEVSKDHFKQGRLELEMAMIEAGAEDIADEEEGIGIKTKVENLQKVLNTLKQSKIEPLRSGIEWVAKDQVTVDDEITKKLGELFGAFEENDDIEDYFTNAG